MADLIKATRSTLTIAVAGAYLVGLVLGVILLSLTKNKEGNTVDVTAMRLVPRGMIGSMDASAPTHTETATFALG